MAAYYFNAGVTIGGKVWCQHPRKPSWNLQIATELESAEQQEDPWSAK